MNETILLVEDDAHTQDRYTRALKAQGYAVRTMRGARAALTYFSAIDTPPMVLVLDVNMPEVSSAQMLRHLRHNLTLTEMKIVLISADYHARREPDMKLADRYVSKPCSPGELVRAVADVLGNPARSA